MSEETAPTLVARTGIEPVRCEATSQIVEPPSIPQSELLPEASTGFKNSPQSSPKLYQLIYADPPWEYRDKASAGNRGACHKYDVMSWRDVCLLGASIRAITAPDCLLAMWHVAPMPAEAIKVVEAWGFELKTFKGFTWHKLTKNGKSHFGMGNWTRANTEDCLFAVRGKPKRINAGVRQFIEAPVREHSRKPDEVRDRLVQLLGDVPRLELFARQRHPGWDVFGNQVKGSINLNAA